ncbi:MAG: malto-oligosyltrehalose synthase [Euzebyales bacterium]|nr:malto-oligosyltrehalose synthase [Euzebyales bacterium]
MRDRQPLSLYRIQLRNGVDFPAVTAQLADLDALGVTHIYLSPILEARPGSTHGYDVTDPRRVDAELGGENGLRALADAAHAHGLGLVADLVPNHVGVDPANRWWTDLLAEGPGGPAARRFDVDWEPALPGAGGKVILPVLGAPYGEVLAAGGLEVAADDGRPWVAYHEHRFPLAAGSMAAHDDLHELLEAQHYRLVHWRIGDRVVNYRRFFAINELAAVRVEDEAVFDDVHGTILRLLTEGVLDGLRIDHVDGLADPTGYVRRLAAQAPQGTWIVVEKILGPGERMPDWPVAGGTGYDFLGDVTRLFVDPAAEDAFTALAAEFESWPGSAPGGGSRPDDWRAAARAAKTEMLDGCLAADADRLARRLQLACAEDLVARDVDLVSCRAAVTALVAALPVYRTYTVPGETARGEDAALLEEAMETARAEAPGVSDHLWAFARDALGGRRAATPALARFAVRFAQVSSAAMAKGVEDTFLYRQHRLLALNEVGVEPVPFGHDVAAFHAANSRRAERCPAGLLTTSTHDTKRGEDVRLRSAALTELPAEWAGAVRRWRGTHAHLLDDQAAQYLLYQTLVGIWPPGGARDRLPALRERVHAYAQKALREAALRTTWADPDLAFEAGVRDFLAALLADDSPFLDELDALGQRVNAIAVTSSLSQVVLRCTSPGVPDTYQGTEGWTDDLVDPDNRRPVDPAERSARLRALEAAHPADLLAAPVDGLVKTWVLARTLRARRERPGAFGAQGEYLPLEVTGRWAAHVVAFARLAPDGDAVVVVASRLPRAVMGDALAPPVGEVWADTAVALPDDLAGTAWRDALGGPGAAGDRLPLAQVLSALPVALLVARGPALTRE